MAEVKKGVVAGCRRLSDVLVTMRLLPEKGSRFPDYRAGQYIALRREDCRLTKRVLDRDGRPRYVPDLDPQGRQRHGPVTHSYSISSAPYETRRDGHLEFYLVLEQDEGGVPGRLTESLFRIDPENGEQIGYFDRIAGDFTLEKRAAGFHNVLLVGTGTGIAPFVSMVKQLHHDQREEAGAARYTLLHANRTGAELAYHEELAAIAAAGRVDLLYLASISRPGPADPAHHGIAKGRANNLLRHVFGMPLKEEEDLDVAAAMGEDVAAAEEALARAAIPVLPANVSRERVRERLNPTHTVVLTCGNASSMADIRRIAEVQGMRFEKEDWKPLHAGREA